MSWCLLLLAGCSSAARSAGNLFLPTALDADVVLAMPGLDAATAQSPDPVAFEATVVEVIVTGATRLKHLIRLRRSTGVLALLQVTLPGGVRVPLAVGDVVSVAYRESTREPREGSVLIRDATGQVVLLVQETGGLPDPLVPPELRLAPALSGDAVYVEVGRLDGRCVGEREHRRLRLGGSDTDEETGAPLWAPGERRTVATAAGSYLILALDNVKWLDVDLAECPEGTGDRVAWVAVRAR